MPYYALLYRAIVALLISVPATSSLAEEIDEATKKRLDSLESRIQKLEAMILTASTPQTSVPKSNYSIPLEAWNTLRAGMRFAAVTAILGNPTSTEMDMRSGNRDGTWYYDSGDSALGNGKVFFLNGRVHSISKPGSLRRNDRLRKLVEGTDYRLVPGPQSATVINYSEYEIREIRLQWSLKDCESSDFDDDFSLKPNVLAGQYLLPGKQKSFQSIRGYQCVLSEVKGIRRQ